MAILLPAVHYACKVSKSYPILLFLLEDRAVLAGRTSKASPEQRAERSAAFKSHVQADFRHPAVCAFEQFARLLQPPPLQVLVWCFVKNFMEQPVKVVR
jgi:hypothetical protein